MDICFCSLTGSVNTHGYKGEIKLQKTAYHFHCARSTSPAVNSSISTKTEEIQFKEKKKKACCEYIWLFSNIIVLFSLIFMMINSIGSVSYSVSKISLLAFDRSLQDFLSLMPKFFLLSSSYLTWERVLGALLSPYSQTVSSREQLNPLKYIKSPSWVAKYNF